MGKVPHALPLGVVTRDQDCRPAYNFIFNKEAVPKVASTRLLGQPLFWVWLGDWALLFRVRLCASHFPTGVTKEEGSVFGEGCCSK